MNTKDINIAKYELYHLLDEGFKAMREGRVSSIEMVEEKIKSRKSLHNVTSAKQ